ncbi:MAG: High-affinity zinc uptake system binding-protein ZnuA precursor [Syntrophorhabdus sp. PtaU1.Bin058]|nr:MAG: High-affinity zinc uptake system binding-protein ZnuA precursor [Syntrophorhabdus sp. PtaU1.Bin058]
MKQKILFCSIIALAVLFSAGACQKKEQPVTGRVKLQVITTLFPLYDFTKNIAGDRADVSLLLPPGVEAHSFEPKAGDMVKINAADLFIYTDKYMEPWVEDILKGVDSKKLIVVDTSKGVTLLEATEAGGHHDQEGARHEGHKNNHDHGKIDPHIWLDLGNAQKMVDNIANGLIEKDPAGKDYYTKNAEVYKAKLDELDKRFRDSLSTCKKDTFIHGGHFAFNYLARRYHLKYFSAYHGSPDSEPTPKRIIELKKKMEELGIHYVYFEELITPRVSEVISRETGATLLQLHGVHNISKEDMDKGATFLSLMERNLENLKVGLQCQQK